MAWITAAATRDELLQEYSDLYKEMEGIRPRWNYGETAEFFHREIEELLAEYTRSGSAFVAPEKGEGWAYHGREEGRELS